MGALAMNMLHAFGMFIFLSWNTLAAMIPEDQSAVNLMSHLQKLDKNFENDFDKIVPIMLKFSLDEKLTNEFLVKQGKVRGRVDYTDSNILYEIPLGSLHTFILEDGSLFFQDLKLERKTNFFVPNITTNLLTRQLNISLHLEEVLITGKYEIAKWDETKKPRTLIYTNDHGDVGIVLLKSVYKAVLKMQVAGNSLVVTDASSIFMSIDQFLTVSSKMGEVIEKRPQLSEIASVMHQLRTSLDKWIIQYINGLLYPMVNLKEMFNNEELLQRYTQYTREYDYLLTNFVDDQVRIYVNDAGHLDRLVLEPIRLTTLYGVKLILFNGCVESLSSLYRKNAFLQTDTPEKMTINAVLAFSRFKVIYNYMAKLPQQVKKLEGNIIFNLDDTEVRLMIVIDKKRRKVSSLYMYMIRTGSYSMTVEGPLNRYYSVVRHLLLHQVLAIVDRTVTTHLNDNVFFGKSSPEEVPQVTVEEGANTTYVCEYKVVTKPETQEMTTPEAKQETT